MRPGTRPTVRGFGGALTLAIGAACAALIPWAGCSVEKHYDVLSFFFDGVPDPNAPALSKADQLKQMRDSPTYTIHKPFAEDKCEDCHGRRFNLTRQDSSICLKCHEGVPEEQPRVHGPVAAAACLWCHTPHESAYAALLKGPAREVCTACHEPSMLGTEKVPEHAPSDQTSCVECHAGHGGTARYFLKHGGGGAAALLGPGGESAP
ncbi:MAG: hypothetical protein IPJ41_07020 [Phycisphaerales bacterium]|nr:hypothetical protein [Phycisphaerales bacterium]